ncbi:MAG: hypothetical protein HWE20_04610 [Gammaproteobacteria bacterium]|nr:hypothetical protein [Gammaproteobacteria bacterium]
MKPFISVCILGIAALSACGGGGSPASDESNGSGGNGTGQSTENNDTRNLAVVGRAVKGVVKNATVDVFELRDGSKVLLGSAQSGADGRYQVEVDSSAYQSGVVLVEVKANADTKMVCDVAVAGCDDGTTEIALPSNFVLKSVSEQLDESDGTTEIQVTVTTHSVASQVERTLEVFKSVSANTVKQLKSSAIVMSGGVDVFSVEPIDMTNIDEVAGASKEQKVAVTFYQATLESVASIAQQAQQSGDISDSQVVDVMAMMTSAETLLGSGAVDEDFVITLAKAVGNAVQEIADNESLSDLFDEEDLIAISNTADALQEKPGEVNEEVVTAVGSKVDGAKQFLKDMRASVFLTDDRVGLLETLEGSMTAVEAVFDRHVVAAEVDAMLSTIQADLEGCINENLTKEDWFDDCLTTSYLDGVLAFEAQTDHGSSMVLEIDSFDELAEQFDNIDSGIEATAMDISATLDLAVKGPDLEDLVTVSDVQVTLGLMPNSDNSDLDIATLTFGEGLTLSGYAMDGDNRTLTAELVVDGLGFEMVARPEWARSAYDDATTLHLTALAGEVSVVRSDGVSISIGSPADAPLIEMPQGGLSLDDIEGRVYKGFVFPSFEEAMAEIGAVNYTLCESDISVSWFGDALNCYAEGGIIDLLDIDGEPVSLDAAVRAVFDVPDNVELFDYSAWIYQWGDEVLVEVGYSISLLENVNEPAAMNVVFEVATGSSDADVISGLAFMDSVEDVPTLDVRIDRPGADIHIIVTEEARGGASCAQNDDEDTVCDYGTEYAMLAAVEVAQGDASMILMLDESHGVVEGEIWYDETLVGTIDDNIVYWGDGSSSGEITFESLF